MLFPAEQELIHLGESCNHVDHDLILELGRRLDSLSRYDQYISNAEQREKLKHFWGEMKLQEQRNVQRMKELLAEEMQNVIAQPNQ